jgi:lipid II:glycine glycyltransferase (peptidoglycan interpeptide bridge formation enzyme)
MKDEKKILPLQKSNAAMQKEIDEIVRDGYDQDKEVSLGAKLIIMQGIHVWNVNMYTQKTLMNFRAAFALHRYVLEDVYKMGAKTYDFEGVSGSLDPHDIYYGMQDFKKSFGGDFLEYLGEFDGVIDEKRYRRWWKSDHLYRRIKNKINYYLNRKAAPHSDN